MTSGAAPCRLAGAQRPPGTVQLQNGDLTLRLDLDEPLHAPRLREHVDDDKPAVMTRAREPGTMLDRRPRARDRVPLTRRASWPAPRCRAPGPVRVPGTAEAARLPPRWRPGPAISAPGGRCPASPSSTYYQEAGRYGDGECRRAAEAVFAADSPSPSHSSGSRRDRSGGGACSRAGPTGPGPDATTLARNGELSRSARRPPTWTRVPRERAEAVRPTARPWTRTWT